MAKLHTAQNVSAEEVRRVLESELSPKFRVSVASDSVLKVGYPGVIPSQVKLSHAGGGTTFSVQTTGLILSRAAQAATINRRVRGALTARYGAGTG